MKREHLHDARCLKQLDDTLYTLYASIKAGYNPNQPRIPSGQPSGGQWTSDAGYISRQHGWRNSNTLEGHTQDHGKNFGTKSSREYARKAQSFRERAIRMKFPAV